MARDTLAYVARELTGAGGGFLSAEDADSVPPSQAQDPSAVAVEGAFYLWSTEELDTMLGADGPLVKSRFGAQPGGNAPHDPMGEFVGLNQFYLARTVKAVAEESETTREDVTHRLSRARSVLQTQRASRPRPHLDDKVLAAWNGLMIGAAARVAQVIADETTTALEMAERAARFARDTLWDRSRRVLRRRYRDGRASIDGYCEDYAFMIWGLLELFQTGGDPEWLAWARELQARQDAQFWDERSGGWFSTTGADSSVLLRAKDDYDGAEPSAGSVSVLNLLTLFHLTNDEDATRRAKATLARFGATPRWGCPGAPAHGVRPVAVPHRNISSCHHRSERASGHRGTSPRCVRRLSPLCRAHQRGARRSPGGVGPASALRRRADDAA